MIIAIDGPAGAGKSTIARQVAQALGFQLIDTGAIYRTVAYHALLQGIDLDDGAACAAIARSLHFSFTLEGDRNIVRCHDQVLGDEIRTQAVSEIASQVSALPEVRAALLEVQRELGRAHDSVLEGRDIGTVVFPDAQLKVFLTASPQERAMRRAAQLREQGQPADEAAIFAEITSRDARDSGRAHAPLLQAHDAAPVDTTGRPIGEVVEEIVQLARQAAS